LTKPERAGTRFFKPLRQIVESINETLKGQLELEQLGGRTSHRRRPDPRLAASLRAHSRHLAHK
jgi:hypothetical protein